MNFFKLMIAALVGSLLAFIVLFLVSFGILAGIIAAASSTEVAVSPKTVLVVKLDHTIKDRAPGMPYFFDFGTGPGKVTGLNDILKNIEKAKTDDNVAGISLELDEIPAGITTVAEIRKALIDFKSSGKFIYAYSNYLSQSGYYLATAADKVFMNPEGGIYFKGLNAELIFLKGTLEKLDVKMQVVRHGKFKSATEPLFLDKMSAENREQITAMITAIWDEMLLNISEARGISKQDLNNMADSLSVLSASGSCHHLLVDSLIYADQYLDILREKMDLKAESKISFMELEKYFKSAPAKINFKADKIAVIYAQGNVVDGEGDEQSIGGDNYAKIIRKAREDNKVKAIVLRVNSPGGSALASEVILREVLLAQEEKPVVASFGDVAASGGYYIACGAGKIIAEPTTLTGSIGVFGVIPNMKGFFNNKLGITFDNAKTNTNADFMSVTQPMTPYQTAVLQREIDKIYEVFVGHVSKGRDMRATQVDSIGQGRIWSGTDAKKIGLIDDFGGLDKAVEVAAEMAGLKEYRLITLPEKKSPIDQILEDFMYASTQSAIQRELGANYQYYEYLKELQGMKGIQARLPFAWQVN